MSLSVTTFSNSDAIISSNMNTPIDEIVAYLNTAAPNSPLTVTRLNAGDRISAAVLNQPLIEIRDHINSLSYCNGPLSLSLYQETENVTAENLNRPLNEIVAFVNNSCSFSEFTPTSAYSIGVYDDKFFISSDGNVEKYQITTSGNYPYEIEWGANGTGEVDMDSNGCYVVKGAVTIIFGTVASIVKYSLSGQEEWSRNIGDNRTSSAGATCINGKLYASFSGLTGGLVIAEPDGSYGEIGLDGFSDASLDVREYNSEIWGIGQKLSFQGGQFFAFKGSYTDDARTLFETNRITIEQPVNPIFKLSPINTGFIAISNATAENPECVYKYNKDTGNIEWTFNITDMSSKNEYTGHFYLKDVATDESKDMIYVACSDNTIRKIKISDGSYVEIHHYNESLDLNQTEIHQFRLRNGFLYIAYGGVYSANSPSLASIDYENNWYYDIGGVEKVAIE